MADAQSGGAAAPPKTHNSDPRQQVKVLADRILRLLEERDAISEDVRDIFKEAKGAGYDVAALRAAVKLAGMTSDERDEFYERESVRDTYVAGIT